MTQVTAGMGEKAKRALRGLPEPAINKIGCAGYCGLSPRARVPTFLTCFGYKGVWFVRKPTIYAGVQRILSPLSVSNRGWGGSKSNFPFFVEPIQPKEIFYQCNFKLWGWWD